MKNFIIVQGFASAINAIISIKFLEKINFFVNKNIEHYLIFIPPGIYSDYIKESYLLNILKKIGYKRILICKKPSDIFQISRSICIDKSEQIYISVQYIEHITAVRKFVSKFHSKRKKKIIIIGDAWGNVGTPVIIKNLNFYSKFKNILRKFKAFLTSRINTNIICKSVLSIPNYLGEKKYKIYLDSTIIEFNFLKNYLTSIRDKFNLYVEPNKAIREKESELKKCIYLCPNYAGWGLVEGYDEMILIEKHINYLINKYDRIYLKPHPSSLNNYSSILIEKLKEKFPKRFRVCVEDTMLPIEIYKDICCYDFFCISSTSFFSLFFLFNIKTYTFINELDPIFLHKIKNDFETIYKLMKPYLKAKNLIETNPNLDRSVILKNLFINDLKK